MATYNITTTLTNCTAAETNPTTIDTGATAELTFTATSGFPFNAFGVSTDGATEAVVLSEDKKSVTVTLSAATKDVSLVVIAKIDDSDINDSYIVKDGILYRIFNDRNWCRWEARWCRENM